MADEALRAYIEANAQSRLREQEAKTFRLKKESHLPALESIEQEDTKMHLPFLMHFEVERKLEDRVIIAPNGQVVYITREPVRMGEWKWRYRCIVIGKEGREGLDPENCKKGVMWHFPPY